VPPRALVLAIALSLVVATAHPFSQASTYTIYTAEGRRTLPFRATGGADMVPLDQLATIFGLTVAEDSLVGGLTVRGRGQTILLIPGQSFASIGPGRVVSLPGPVQRDRNVWQVPVEFIGQVVGPALNLRVDLRRPSHVILVGDVRLPRITARVDRQGPNVRLAFDVQPAAAHRIARQGTRLTIRFDAVAIDFAPFTGAIPEFVTGVRADGTSILVDLGPSTVGYRADDVDPTHFEITLLSPAPVVPPPPPAPAPAPAAPAPGVPAAPAAPVRPIVDTTPGAIRTIVLDPGHGGSDVGAKGSGGTEEKTYVLQFARKLKSAIEGRIGVRVLLTRDGDENTPVDRRAALANNNKADLFISLHANASVRPAVSGLQVLSLRLDDYRGQAGVADTPEVPVAVLGGGTRRIDVLPWDLAQTGFTSASATIASILRQHLVEAQVPMFIRPVAQLPLRPLVGASMPAIMIELGFLTNSGDEQALNGAARPQAVIDAILATIGNIRNGVPAAAPPQAPQ
jgi:N-acetylmuramoyl-L-alanine amidase